MKKADNKARIALQFVSGFKGIVSVSVVGLLVDGFVLGNFQISHLLSVFVFFVLVGFRRDATQQASFPLFVAKATIPIASCVLVWVCILSNAKLAEQRAQAIVHACDSFYEERSEFPHSLNDLVPRHLPSVPLSKLTLLSNNFGYARTKSGHVLAWVVIRHWWREVVVLEDVLPSAANGQTPAPG